MKALEDAQLRMAVERVRLARAHRERDRAAKPTGVRLRSETTVQVQDIYDDGSIRNTYKRNPALSGRQFRKARKALQRAMRAKASVGTLRA